MSESHPVERAEPRESPDLTATVTLVNKGEDSPPREGVNKLEIYKVSVSLVKALVWPALLLFFFAEFHAPIQKIVDQLPGKFSRASKVSFGNVTLEIIQEKAREAGLPDVAEKLGELSPDAVEALLNIGKNTTHHLVGRHDSREAERYYTFPREAAMRTLLELQGRGFLGFSEDYSDFLQFMAELPLEERLTEVGGRRVLIPVQPLSPGQEERLYGQSYRLTKQGEEALDSVIQAVAEQLKKKTATEESSATE